MRGEIEQHVKDLEQLLRQKDYEEIIFRVRTLLKFDLCSSEPRLHRLLGVSFGRMGRHLEAKNEFLNAFEISDSDNDMANTIGALWPLGESALALEIIDDCFLGLSPEAQKMIAMNTLQAIRLNAILEDQLPTDIKIYLKNVKVIY